MEIIEVIIIIFLWLPLHLLPISLWERLFKGGMNDSFSEKIVLLAVSLFFTGLIILGWIKILN